MRKYWNFVLVMDTGIGVDKENQDKLFKAFSQVDASISRKYGGTGLGLNITKQFVEMMGGSISVESQKNKGTTFTFSVWVGDGDAGSEEYTLPDATVRRSHAELSAALKETQERKETDPLRVYGTPENAEALEKTLSKMILCIEMENWIKAEDFMETVRQLMEGAPRDAAKSLLRLKMAVQKENYEKAIASLEEMKANMEQKAEEGDTSDGS